MPYLQFHRLTLLDVLRCNDNLLALSWQEVEEIVCELRPLDRDFHKDIACQLLGREGHLTLAVPFSIENFSYIMDFPIAFFEEMLYNIR